MPHKKREICHEHEVCPALGFQEVEVCVPVEVRPSAEIGRINTSCLGEPIIHRGCDHCEGSPCTICKFNISQKLRVEVPVTFTAKTEVGEAHIKCESEHCNDHESESLGCCG